MTNKKKRKNDAEQAQRVKAIETVLTQLVHELQVTLKDINQKFLDHTTLLEIVCRKAIENVGAVPLGTDDHDILVEFVQANVPPTVTPPAEVPA